MTEVVPLKAQHPNFKDLRDEVDRMIVGVCKHGRHVLSGAERCPECSPPKPSASEGGEAREALQILDDYIEHNPKSIKAADEAAAALATLSRLLSGGAGAR